MADIYLTFWPLKKEEEERRKRVEVETFFRNLKPLFKTRLYKVPYDSKLNWGAFQEGS